jgi:hypothetical protein
LYDSSVSNSLFLGFALVEGGEEENKNFDFDETFSYAHDRVRNKKPGETIKKDRLINIIVKHAISFQFISSVDNVI